MSSNFSIIGGAATPIIDGITLISTLGDPISLIPQLQSLTLYEDIFSPVLSGEILIADNVGYFDHLPISGNEKLIVRFRARTYDDSNAPVNFIHREFDIVKISNIKQVNDFTKTYMLHFISPEAKKNETMKVSLGFKNMRISEIVERIITGTYDEFNADSEPDGLGFSVVGASQDTISSKPISPKLTNEHIQAHYEHIPEDGKQAVELFIEKTKYEEPVVTIPYMRPFDAIKWLSNRSIRDAGDESISTDFLFFENKRGFQYTSITSLLETNNLESKSVLKFGEAYQNVNNQLDVIDRIENLTIENCYDVLNNIRSGSYSSKLYTYDFSTGIVKSTTYDLLDRFYKNYTVDRGSIRSSNNILGPEADYPPMQIDSNRRNTLTKRYNSKIMLCSVLPSREYDNITSSPTDRVNTNKSDIGPEEYLQNRMYQISKLSNFRVTIEMPANSKHKVGDVVELDLRQWIGPLDKESSKLEMPSHKYYSGNYLITAIKHVLTLREYKMQIELIKDSLKAEITAPKI